MRITVALTALLLSSTAVLAQSAMTECRSGENMKTGTAVVAATFIVTRGGQRVFTRDYRVTREWQSYFMAMQAVPAALDGFTSLFPKLVEKALSDPELVRALRA